MSMAIAYAMAMPVPVAVASVGLTAYTPRFDHIFYFLANRFCHTSVSNTFRASVQRSANKFRLRGMCSH